MTCDHIVLRVCKSLKIEKMGWFFHQMINAMPPDNTVYFLLLDNNLVSEIARTLCSSANTFSVRLWKISMFIPKHHRFQLKGNFSAPPALKLTPAKRLLRYIWSLQSLRSSWGIFPSLGSEKYRVPSGESKFTWNNLNDYSHWSVHQGHL